MSEATAASIACRRLLIIVQGSKGDIEPHIAIAVSLQKAGLVVGITSSPDFHRLVQAASTSIHFFSNSCPSYPPFFSSDECQRAFQTGDLAQYVWVDERTRKNPKARREMSHVLQSIDIFKPDAVITAGPLHEETTGWLPRAKRVPALQVILSPWHFRPKGSPLASAGVIGRARFRTQVDEYIETVEQQTGKPRDQWCPREADWLYPCGYGSNEQVANADPLLCLTWSEFYREETDPPTMIYTGYPLMSTEDHDQSADRDTEERLKAFLDAGAPPTYIGYGSMRIDDPKTLMAAVVQAVKVAGVRAIVLSGSRGFTLDAITEPALKKYAAEKIIFIGRSVNRMTLYPKCSVLVHYGGHGTTMAAIRSGTPSIVTSKFDDQERNGMMLQEKGLGLCIQPFLQITAESLGKAISTVAQDATMKQRCLAAARIVANTDPLKTITDYIVKWMKEKVITGEQMQKVDADWELQKQMTGACPPTKKTKLETPSNSIPPSVSSEVGLT